MASRMYIKVKLGAAAALVSQVILVESEAEQNVGGCYNNEPEYSTAELKAIFPNGIESDEWMPLKKETMFTFFALVFMR